MRITTVTMISLVAVLGGVGQAKVKVTSGGFSMGAPVDGNIDCWFDQNTAYGSRTWWANSDHYLAESHGSTATAFLGDGDGKDGGPKGAGGRYIYQSIGTKEPNTDYTILFNFGQPDDGSIHRRVGLTVDIYQGAFADAADDVNLTGQGLALVTSFTIKPTSLMEAFERYVGELDLSAANTEDELWIRVSNIPGQGSDASSQVVVDNIQIVSESMATLRKRYGWQIPISPTD